MQERIVYWADERSPMLAECEWYSMYYVMHRIECKLGDIGNMCVMIELFSLQCQPLDMELQVSCLSFMFKLQ